MTDRTCIAPHCERPVRCKDRCARCYQRARKSGEIPAAWISPPHYSSFEERFWCKVDQETTPEGCWTWTAYRSPDGYGRFGIYTGRNAVAHRVSYELEVGPIPDGMNIDHKCHNRACVRPDHLRAVTQKQNVENRSGLRIGNTSGVNGVSWARKQKAWAGHGKAQLPDLRHRPLRGHPRSRSSRQGCTERDVHTQRSGPDRLTVREPG